MENVPPIEAESGFQATKPFADRLASFAVFVFCRAVDEIAGLVGTIDQSVEQARNPWMHRHKAVAGSRLVHHSHESDARIGVNADIRSPKLRDSFDPRATMGSDPDRGCQ